MLLNFLEPSFKMGPFTLHLYGMALTAALLVGIYLAQRFAAKKNIPADLILSLALYCIVGALIGARLFSVALHMERFLGDPLYLFQVHQGGLSFFGGLGGGVFGGWWFTRRYKINFWTVADLFAPSLAIGEAIVRLGCDVYGTASESAIWPRVVDGVPHHNIPLYMVVSSLLLFALLLLLKNKTAHGQLFMVYLIGYFISRSIIDYFREEPSILFFNQAQLAGIFLLAIVLIVIAYRKRLLQRDARG